MRHVLVATALALLVSGCSGIGLDALSSKPSLRASVGEPIPKPDPGAARELINSYRRSKGLSELTIDPKLTQMAEQHAKSMAAANRMSHKVGGSFTSRLARSGYDAGTAAENLGAGYFTAEDVVAGWRRSRGHNRNLLLSDARHVGIAAAQAPGTRYKVYWALVVAEPAEAMRERTAGTSPGSSRVSFRVPVPSLSSLVSW